ncbi:MAG: hypothetical protein U9N49_01715, partial [Campylobacterota bacterium]|nr:hypothetical protein [Campylobacterota bacterium]
YQIDTQYIDTPRVLRSFDFDQTTDQLYFTEDKLYTPRYIINLDALILSSPYITVDLSRELNKEYSIDLEKIKDPSIFGRF